MNYILALLAAMAIAVCLMTFPVPTLIALAVAVAWWLIRGRKRGLH